MLLHYIFRWGRHVYAIHISGGQRATVEVSSLSLLYGSLGRLGRKCIYLLSHLANFMLRGILCMPGYLQSYYIAKDDLKLLLLLLFFWDRVSLYSPDCPGTQYVEQAGLELIEICLPPECWHKGMRHQTQGWLVFCSSCLYLPNARISGQHSHT